MYMKTNKKYYLIYKTTNLKNGKFYIGAHVTVKLNDGYLGSGKVLRNSVYYHGKEKFKREILEFCENKIEMFQREKEIVTEELISDPKCLNLKIGGEGGGTFSSEQQRINAIHSNEKQKKLKEIDKEWYENKCKNISLGNKKVYDEGKREKKYFYDWNGKYHNENTKKLIGNKNSINQKGNKNSQFGTCWITNGIENKKIKKEEQIPDGWKLGRK